MRAAAVVRPNQMRGFRTAGKGSLRTGSPACVALFNVPVWLSRNDNEMQVS